MSGSIQSLTVVFNAEDKKCIDEDELFGPFERVTLEEIPESSYAKRLWLEDRLLFVEEYPESIQWIWLAEKANLCSERTRNWPLSGFELVLCLHWTQGSHLEIQSMLAYCSDIVVAGRLHSSWDRPLNRSVKIRRWTFNYKTRGLLSKLLSNASSYFCAMAGTTNLKRINNNHFHPEVNPPLELRNFKTLKQEKSIWIIVELCDPTCKPFEMSQILSN